MLGARVQAGYDAATANGRAAADRGSTGILRVRVSHVVLIAAVVFLIGRREQPPLLRLRAALESIRDGNGAATKLAASKPTFMRGVRRSTAVWTTWRNRSAENRLMLP